MSRGGVTWLPEGQPGILTPQYFQHSKIIHSDLNSLLETFYMLVNSKCDQILSHIVHSSLPVAESLTCNRSSSSALTYILHLYYS